MSKKLLTLFCLFAMLASCGGQSFTDTVLWVGQGANYLRTGQAAGEILSPFGKYWEADIGGMGVGAVAIAQVPKEIAKGSDKLAGISQIVFTTSSDGAIFAFDFESGFKVWETRLNGAVGNPTYGEGKVAIACVDATLNCLDAWTGEKVWSVKYNSEADPRPQNSSQIIKGGIIYCALSAKVVIAYDLGDGQEIWKTVVDDSIQASPVMIENRLFVATYAPSVYCLDSTNGKEIWKNSVKYPVTSSLISNGNLVFVPQAFGVVTAFSSVDGKEIWSCELNGTIPFASCLTRDYLVIANALGKTIVALNQNTGKTEFTVNVSEPKSGLVCTSSNVFFGASDGKVYTVDLTTKKVLDAYTFDQNVQTIASREYGDPAIVGGRLFISDGINKLYMLVPKELVPKEQTIKAIQPGDLNEKSIEIKPDDSSKSKKPTSP